MGNLEKQHSHHWDDGKWCFPSPPHWGFLALIKKSPNQTSLYSTPSPTTLSSKLQSAPSVLLGSAIHQVLLTTWFMRSIGRSREIRGFAAFFDCPPVPGPGLCFHSVLFALQTCLLSNSSGSGGTAGTAIHAACHALMRANIHML